MKANYNKSEIFNNAWNLVKSLSITLAEALRRAWKSAKLLLAGGKSWIKNSYNRIYINNDALLSVVGYEWGYYKTGNLEWATINNDHISNSKFSKIFHSVNKFWYDVTTGKFDSQLNSSIGNDLVEEFINKI